MMIVVVVGTSAVGVNAHIVYKRISVVVLIASNFDEIIPVHDGADEVLKFVLLRLFLYFKVLTDFKSFVFNFLTGSFGTVIQETGALSLAFISAHVTLFQCLFLLFANAGRSCLLPAFLYSEC